MYVNLAAPAVTRRRAKAAATARRVWAPAVVCAKFLSARAVYTIVRQGQATYRSALIADPNFARALYNLAIIRAGAGANAEAIDLYRHVITVEPNNAAAHLNLGFLLQATGSQAARDAGRRSHHPRSSTSGVSWTIQFDLHLGHRLLVSAVRFSTAESARLRGGA